MTINTAFGFETSFVNSRDIWKTSSLVLLNVAADRYHSLNDSHFDRLFEVRLKRFTENYENHVFNTNLKRVISYIPGAALFVSYEEGFKAAWTTAPYPDRWAHYTRALLSLLGLGIIFLIPDIIILAKRVLTTNTEDTFYLNFQRRFENLDKMSDSKKSDFRGEIEAYYEFVSKRGDAKKASHLLYMYGRTLYGGDMEKAAKYFLASVEVELNGKAPSSFKRIQSKTFEEIEPLLEKAKESRSFSLAVSLKWYGFASQNTESCYQPFNYDSFQKLYGTVITILEKIGTKDSFWEIGQVIYNMRPIHYLKHPGDSVGALKTLEVLPKYLKKEGQSLRAQTLYTQILNITAVETSKLPQTKETIEKQFNCFKQASCIAETTQGFDPFLKTLFINNKAQMAIKLNSMKKVASDEEITAWFETVERYMEEQQFNHFYFATFYLNMARFYRSLSYTPKTIHSLNQAKMICEKFPNNLGVNNLLVQINNLFQEVGLRPSQ